MLILFWSLVAGARVAPASSLADRLELRTCQHALAPAEEFYLRRALVAHALRDLGDFDHLVLAHFRRLDPEIAARRAFAVDEVLELLGEQPAFGVEDAEVRRRPWQMRLFGDLDAAPPGLTPQVLGDRLRWDRRDFRLSDGEFVVQLHWDDQVPPELVDQLPDLVRLAHAGVLDRRWPLRMLRAGDPRAGELYALVDGGYAAHDRLTAALDLFARLEAELNELTASAVRR